MSFPRYPAYKDSGVEWLSQVPAHWEVEPCRAVFTERSDRNDPLVNEDYLSLMANVGVIPYAEKGDVGNKKPEDLTKCKLVFAGDLVINSMNYGIGSYGLSSLTGVCSPVYIVLKPKLEKIEERFAFRILENKAFQGFAQSHGNGILEHRAAINWDILKGIGVPLPPVAEQQAILGFLDRETAKIDALVAEQEQLITLLKEKRQAVISHAVTKGLDPSVPMKDSGVEWLGAVPAHWELKPLKYLGAITSGFAFKSSDFSTSGVRVLKIANIQTYSLDWSDESYLPESFYKQNFQFAVKDGDVVFALTRPIISTGLKAAIANIGDERILLNQRNAIFRPMGQLNKYFIYQLFFSDSFRVDFECKIDATGQQPNISPIDIGDIRIPLPPMDEQTAIAEHLKNLGGKFDVLITTAQNAIDLLQERRSALISAAVTGQIDTRGESNGVKS